MIVSQKLISVLSKHHHQTEQDKIASLLAEVVDVEIYVPEPVREVNPEIKLTKQQVKDLQLLLKVIPTRPTHPVLSYVRVQASQDYVTFAATNLAQSIIYTVAKEGVEVEFLIPAIALKGIKEGITVKHNENESTVTVTTDKGVQATTSTLSSGDFPDLAIRDLDKEEKHSVVLRSQGLRDAIGNIGCCVSTEETKQVLCGMQFTPDLLRCRMEAAATDGHQLGWASIIGGVQDQVAFTVPGSTINLINEVFKFLKKRVPENIAANWTMGETYCEYIEFNMGSYLIQSRLLEGRYPAYEQLIPSQFTGEIAIKNPKAVAKLLWDSRVEKNKNGEMVLFTKSQGGILATMEYKDNKVEVPIEGRMTLDEIAFNVKYLKNALEQECSGEMKADCNKGMQPVIFRGDKSSFLIMPIKIKRSPFAYQD